MRTGSVEGSKMRKFSLYRPADIVRVIKSRRIRWEGNVSKMEEDRCAFKILIGKRLLKCLSVDERTY